jgi:hypothetical protein
VAVQHVAVGMFKSVVFRRTSSLPRTDYGFSFLWLHPCLCHTVYITVVVAVEQNATRGTIGTIPFLRISKTRTHKSSCRIIYDCID